MSKEAKKLQEIQPPYTDDLTVRAVYAELCGRSRSDAREPCESTSRPADTLH